MAITYDVFCAYYGFSTSHGYVMSLMIWDPIIGANIIIKGCTTGVISDVDGNFKIQVPSLKNTILKVSFIGYQEVEIPLNGKTTLR